MDSPQPRPRRLLTRLAASIFLPLLLLSSCAYSDPDYQRLSAVAEVNPPKDAVLGMWHRRRNDMDLRWRMNMLFKSDGTGIVEAYMNCLLEPQRSGDAVDSLGDFTWTYVGNGVWNLRSIRNPQQVDTCRISQGRLLRSMPEWPFSGPAFLVYERINP